MSKKNNKYIFILNDINITRVNLKYNINIENLIEDPDPSDTTKLTDLNINKGTQKLISFLDESKRIHSCQVSMIDFTSRMNVNLLRYHCFWCKSPFDSRSIGCPIKYISKQAIKKISFLY